MQPVCAPTPGNVLVDNLFTSAFHFSWLISFHLYIFLPNFSSTQSGGIFNFWLRFAFSCLAYSEKSQYSYSLRKFWWKKSKNYIEINFFNKWKANDQTWIALQSKKLIEINIFNDPETNWKDEQKQSNHKHFIEKIYGFFKHNVKKKSVVFLTRLKKLVKIPDKKTEAFWRPRTSCVERWILKMEQMLVFLIHWVILLI